MDFMVSKTGGADAVYGYLRDYSGDKSLIVNIKIYRRDRSKEQNALFHVWVAQISQDYNLSHGELYSPAAWKEYLKFKLLGEEILDVPGDSMVRTRRTRDLNVKQMTEFMEQVVWFCATEFNINLSSNSEL